MVVKSLYYLMAIFSAIFLSVLMQEPYLLERFALNESAANVEMQNVVNCELTENEVKSITKAKNVVRYKDKDIAYDVQVLFKKNGYLYSLEGDVGDLVNDIITFSEDVLVNRSDGMIYKSKELSYDVKKKILSSNVNFTLSGDTMDINGSAFKYDLEQKVISGDNIFAKFNVEDS